MSLVVLETVTLFFADRLIFDAVDLRVGHGERIGLIGPNGTGKTTLLKVIAGEQELDDGQVVRARGVRVGWLPQDLAIAGGRSLRDFVLSTVPGRATLDAELAAVESELAGSGRSDDDLLELAARAAELHERIAHHERYFSEHDAMAILAGLGFAPGDEHRDLGEFSGGWKMRGVLAALLFQRPDLLLLDEPTNHLDLPSVAWFADFLKKWQSSFVLISHDREFLNEQVSRVVSLEVEGVRSYPGNLDRYVVQRAEEESILEGRAKNLARERERLSKFVDRFRAQANKARAVQSRIKMLEKMETVDSVAKRGVMRFAFPATTRPVSEVVKVDGLAKAYGDRTVLSSVNLAVRRGEKIGIIGVNGAGKTTLLRIIAEEMAATAGTVRLGSGVTAGYYAQHHADTLDLSATIAQVVQRANPDATPARIRSVLGAFMFSGDDIDKPIRVLSGGERARVALARLLVAPGNLLLMDEPTNHLDLDSSESLCKSLQSYDGTMIFVSHNRSLIRGLATKIWNVDGGRVEEYPGTLDEYLYSMSVRRQADEGDGNRVPDRSPQSAPPVAREDDKARKRREAEARNQRSRTLGPLEKQVANLEERIAELEAAQRVRSADLADPEVYADDQRRRDLLSGYQQAQSKLEELTERWEHAMSELEAARAALD